jgi:mitochondrial fission protein ELM1
VKSPHQKTPSVWLLIGDKAGDNTQAKLVADSLGLAYEIKHLLPKTEFLRGKPRFKASLDHLDLNDSDDLQPPWPDLVITIGRRHSMAALWIKDQSPATRIVLIGRPRRWIEKFDLVITLPQYRLPGFDNVLPLSWPLIRSEKNSIVQAGDEWSDRLANLDRPITAVFVGGPTQPYRFDRSVTLALIDTCNALQKKQPGSLFFVTSPRTTPEITATLKNNLPPSARLYLWKKGAPDNPYKALLALADRCIVSGDSVSMMMEAADLAKPLAIFELPRHFRGRLWQAVTGHLFGNRDRVSAPGRLWRLGMFLYEKGIIGFPRDLSLIHDSLTGTGRATRLGDGFSVPAGPLPSELPVVRQRIRALLDS